jgi:hypothetical protein
MRLLAAAVLSSSLLVNGYAQAAIVGNDGEFFFRYRATDASLVSGPAHPVPAADITAHYVGVVGFPFSEKMPLTAGRSFSSWKIVKGSLPEGLSFDSATGAVSGTPTLEGKGYEALVQGFGPAGEPVGIASIQIDVFKANDKYQKVDFYGHTNHYNFEQLPIPAGMAVDHWSVFYAPPPGVQVIGRNYDGTPTKPGRYPVAVQGFDYLNKEIILLTGYYLVEDGPTFPLIADDVRPLPVMPGFELFDDVPYGVTELDPTANPGIRYTTEIQSGSILPGSINLYPAGRLFGRVGMPYETATVRWKAVDIDGTVGYSNWWKIGTSNPEPSFYASMLGPFQMIVGQHYEIGFATVGTPGSKNFTISSGTLPKGLSLDPSTGFISGTPSQEEKQDGITLHLAITNNGHVDETTSVPFTINVSPQAVGLRQVGASPLNVRTNAQFIAAVEAYGDVRQPAAISMSSSVALPGGVTFDAASASVSGKVANAGLFAWPVDFLNGDGRPASASIRVGVYNPLSIDATPDIKVTQFASSLAIHKVTYDPMSVVPFAPGATMPQISLVGTLPAGITYNPLTETLQGGTSEPIGRYGPYAFTITDGSGASVTGNTFYIDVEERDPLQVTVADPTFIVGLDQGINPVVQLVRPPLSATQRLAYSLTGTLPEGLSFNPDNGVISGTAVTLGDYPGFVLTVADADGAKYAAVSAPFTIHAVAAGPITQLAIAPVRTPVDYPLSIPGLQFANTIGALTYAVDGTLPDGLTLDPSTGAISGVPTQVSSGSITINVTDGEGRTGQGRIDLSVLNHPTLDAGVYGTALVYARLENKSIQLVAHDLIGAGTYRLVSGKLPKGLVLSSTSGTISGVPEVEGTTQGVIVGVTDAATSLTATAALSITVGPRNELTISYGDMPTIFDNAGMGMPLGPTVNNSSGGVVYSIIGAVPPGLAFNTSTGVFSGQATTYGDYPLTVSGKDSDGSTATAAFVLRVSKAWGISGPAEIAGGVWRVGEPVVTPSPAYTSVVLPIAYLTVDAPPTGLAIAPDTGVISGATSQAGDFVIEINAVDAHGRTKWYGNTREKLSVRDHLQFATQPANTVSSQYAGTPVSIVPVLVNGIGKVTYSLTGSLPAGVLFDVNTGVISGKPQVKGTYPSLTIVATDLHDADTVVSQPFTLTVGDRLPLAATLPTVALTLANHDIQKIAKTNVANASYGDSVTFSYSGTLPTGVKFDAATGTFHGTATELGDYPGITVTITDSIGAKATSAPMTIRSVLDGGPIILNVADIVTKVGYPFSTGVPPVENFIGDLHFYSYDIVPQIKLNAATGEMSGSFKTVQDFDFDLFVGDETDRTTSDRLKVQVLPPLRVVAPTIVAVKQGNTVNQAVDTLYKAGVVSYAKGAGAWPAGISVDPATGAITGTTNVATGTYAGLTIVGTDRFGVANVDTQSSNVFSIVVAPTDANPVIANLGKTVYGSVGSAGTPVKPVVTDSKLGKPWAYAGTTYSINRALPAGLNFDTSTGVISGTPTAAGVVPDLVITVTAESGATASTLPFWFGVAPAGQITPTAGQVTTYYQRTDKTSKTNPISFDNVGGSFTLTAQPGTTSGFDPATGVYTQTPVSDPASVINGQPADGWTNVTTITDEFGRTGSFTFKAINLYPVAISVPTPTLRVYKNVSITDLEKPTTTGVYGTAAYSATGLPTGLTINPSTGAISGTVTDASQAGDHLVTVTVTDQYANAPQARSATYTVTLLEGGVPHRYWRAIFNPTYSYYVNFGGVDLIATDGSNLSTRVIDGTATASITTRFVALGMSGCVDGNIGTECYPVVDDTGQIVIYFDFNSPVYVDSAKWTARTDGFAGSVYNMRIESSDDNSGWFTEMRGTMELNKLSETITR